MRCTNSEVELVRGARAEGGKASPERGREVKSDIERAIRTATLRFGRKFSSMNCWGRGVVRRVSFVEVVWMVWRARAFSLGVEADSYWEMASWMVLEREERSDRGGSKGGSVRPPGGPPAGGGPDIMWGIFPSSVISGLWIFR